MVLLLLKNYAMKICVTFKSNELQKWMSMALNSLGHTPYDFSTKKWTDDLWQDIDVLLIEPSNISFRFITFYQKMAKIQGTKPLIILGHLTDKEMDMIPHNSNWTYFLHPSLGAVKTKTTISNLEKRLNQISDKVEGMLGAKLGGLNSLNLNDVIQMLCLSLWTGVVEVFVDINSTGKVWIESGTIVNVSTPYKMGKEALIEMLNWEKKQFIFKEKLKTNHKEDYGPWEIFLLECSKSNDEAYYENLLPFN